MKAVGARIVVLSSGSETSDSEDGNQKAPPDIIDLDDTPPPKSRTQQKNTTPDDTNISRSAQPYRYRSQPLFADDDDNSDTNDGSILIL